MLFLGLLCFVHFAVTIAADSDLDYDKVMEIVRQSRQEIELEFQEKTNVLQKRINELEDTVEKYKKSRLDIDL